MKITNQQLKQIIKEELTHVLFEKQKLEEDMLKKAAQAIGLGALVMFGFANSGESPVKEKSAQQQLQDIGVEATEISKLPVNTEGDVEEEIKDAADKLYKKYSRGMQVASNLESKKGVRHPNQKDSTIAMFAADAENLEPYDKSAYLLWHNVGISDEAIKKISSGDKVDSKTANALLMQAKKMGLSHGPEHEIHQEFKNQFTKELGSK